MLGLGLMLAEILYYIVIFLWFSVLFYLSFKKCLLKEDMNKTGFFFISLAVNPFFALVESILGISILLANKSFCLTLHDLTSIDLSDRTTFMAFTAVLFAIIVIFDIWLISHFLNSEKKMPGAFLYLMFCTFFVISFRSERYGDMFSIPYLGAIISFTGDIIWCIAVWTFYRLDVGALSKLKQVHIKIDWKIFIVPPALFCIFYSVFALFLSLHYEEKLALTVSIFSTIIVFLFIWAFYVIIKNIAATDEALKAKEEVKTLSVEVMEALAHTIDAKDEYTKGHSIRVAKYSKMIAEKMGLSPEECENVYYMGLLHDIGKIGVPNEIINSPTKLTDDEYAVIKTHPVLGYDILAEIKSRPDLSIGARWHHERFDGKGYPDNKNGDSIPLFARIIAVADSYDAMTSNRSYRKLLSQETVRSEIENNIGTQFDPEVAKCMLAIIDDDVEYKLHE